MVLVAGHLEAFHVGRRQQLFLAVEGAGIVNEGEAVLHVLHLLGRVGAVPRVDGGRTAFAVGEQERQAGAGHHREAPGLVARVDVGHVGDAVLGHVVVIECLAELLGGKQRGRDRAARLFRDVGAPGRERGVQCMLCRHPARKLERDRLVLRLSRQWAGQDLPDRSGDGCERGARDEGGGVWSHGSSSGWRSARRPARRED